VLGIATIPVGVSDSTLAITAIVLAVIAIAIATRILLRVVDGPAAELWLPDAVKRRPDCRSPGYEKARSERGSGVRSRCC
jgi:hypothetical protein